MRVAVYKFNMIRSIGVGMETYDAAIHFWVNLWWWMLGLEVKRRFKR